MCTAYLFLLGLCVFHTENQTYHSCSFCLLHLVWSILTMRAIHLQNNGYLVANNNEVYNFGTGNFSMKAWVYSSTGGPVISRKSTAGGVGEWRIRMDDHYRRWYWIRLSNQQSHQRARWHLASRCSSMRTDLCSNLSRWRAGCNWPQIRRQATTPGCKV